MSLGGKLGGEKQEVVCGGEEGRRETEMIFIFFICRENRPMIGDILVGRAPYFKVSVSSMCTCP